MKNIEILKRLYKDYTKNYLNLMQEDQMAEDICRELSEEMESVANEDIPF